MKSSTRTRSVHSKDKILTNSKYFAISLFNCLIAIASTIIMEINFIPKRPDEMNFWKLPDGGILTLRFIFICLPYIIEIGLFYFDNFQRKGEREFACINALLGLIGTGYLLYLAINIPHNDLTLIGAAKIFLYGIIVTITYLFPLRKLNYNFLEIGLKNKLLSYYKP